MSTNSQAAYEEVEQAEQRRHERDLERTAHAQNLSDIFEGTEVELLRELMETKLDSGTIRVLDNYISPDFILSNLREKDITKFEWQLETKVLRVFAMHPPQGGVAGKARTYYYNDPKDALEPLRPQDRALIREYKDGILFRVRRSHKGFQQDKIGEQSTRVETVSREDEDGAGSGRVRGLLRR